MKATSNGVTDLGRKRSVNEDNYKICPRLNLYLVADGMGGHIAGEIASRLAVDIISEAIQKELYNSNGDFHPGRLLGTSIQLANKKILETANKHRELEGMGTTIVAGLVKDRTLHIASVGDSRIYRFRNNIGQLLTSDHSWVNMQVRLGNITAEEARYHPMRNVITRALGTQRDVEVDIMAHLIHAGDTILFCTDGLSNLIQTDELVEIISNHAEDLENCTKQLVDLANSRGGDDNITVVLLQFPASEFSSNDDFEEDNDQDTEIIPVEEVKNRLKQKRLPNRPP